jgi:hypothetical protein
MCCGRAAAIKKGRHLSTLYSAATFHASTLNVQMSGPSKATGFTIQLVHFSWIARAAASTKVWLCLEAQPLDRLHQPWQHVGHSIHLTVCCRLQHDNRRISEVAMLELALQPVPKQVCIELGDRSKRWQVPDALMSDLVSVCSSYSLPAPWRCQTLGPHPPSAPPASPAHVKQQGAHSMGLLSNSVLPLAYTARGPSC